MNPLITVAANEPLQPVRAGIWKRAIAAGDRLNVDEIFLEEGVETAEHGHDRHQVAYHVTGRFEVMLEGSTVTLGPGDGYTIPANASHRVRCLERGSYVLATVQPGEGTAAGPHAHDDHHHS